MSDTGVLALVAVAMAAGWAVGRASAVHSRVVVITLGDDDDDDDLPDFGFPIRSDPDMARMN